jgi:putative membrane protein
MHYWQNDWDGSWLGGLFMLISMVLLWGGLITVVIVLLRHFGRTGSDHNPGRDHNEALRILNERFARGEIDKDEYEQRRTTLER